MTAINQSGGSGTTAYVAEQWGRRWITIDTSRVPLALARQRLLTATFPYYEINPVGPDRRADRSAELPESGAPGGRALPTDGVASNPSAGFVYKRKQNAKGEEIGGIVSHVTLKSIANNEPPEEEVLVDRPEVVNGVVRVTGPFVVEATIPTPVDFEGDGVEDSRAKTPEEIQGHVERMLEALRRSPPPVSSPDSPPQCR
jgi:adenine-specific DNA-methyltransferase